MFQIKEKKIQNSLKIISLDSIYLPIYDRYDQLILNMMSIAKS